MAVKTNAVILFSRVKDGNKTLQWPVAVFSNHDQARSFATVLGMAHKNGDADTAKQMDPATKVDDGGKLVPGLRFSITEVRYSPSASLGASDMFDEDNPPTS